MSRPVRFLFLACTLLLSGCAAAWPRRWSDRPCCIEQKPVIRRQPVWWHLFDLTVLDPLAQPFRVVRPLRKLAGLPVRSLNLRGGQLADSAFFTNRDPAGLSAEAVRWGPTRPSDLPQPPFTVTKAKMEGKTAGFFVTDAQGACFLFKLDPVQAPELLSGAEAVTSKLLYALGYHVPSYEVVVFSPGQLMIADNATRRSGSGTVAFTQQDLDGLLADRIQQQRVRVVSSRILDGEILGPGPFKKFKDCTEMRALKLAYAWVNNIDTKDHNSLLVWDGSRVVGYLFDFGTSLGADAGLGGPKHPCAGWTYAFDLKEASLEVLTLGLHQPVCDAQRKPKDAQVGLFSPSFEPQRWKPYVPNRAFKEMNEADAGWMARRMKRLSVEQITAAVSAGQYSKAEDAAYLVDVLQKRRQAILERYLDEDDDEEDS